MYAIAEATLRTFIQAAVRGRVAAARARLAAGYKRRVILRENEQACVCFSVFAPLATQLMCKIQQSEQPVNCSAYSSA